MNEDVLNLGRSALKTAYGLDKMKKDKDGFLRLTPTAKRSDEQLSSLTSSISSLEDKLQRYREEKSKVEKFQKTDTYKESKKGMSKKKQKKRRESLLEMVFNNADKQASEAESEDEEDDGAYRDNRKGKKRASSTTMDTTIGKRFSPLVGMLHDTVNEFDQIARDIESELNSSRAKAPTKYRSDQMSNLISAKGQKFSAIKELVAVAKTVSDLEYKKEKDQKANEGSDTSKAISALGARYLRGGLDEGSKKKKAKDKDRRKKKYDDDDDDDEEEMSITKLKASDPDFGDDRELASELAETLLKKKQQFSFTPAERAIAIEGTYDIMVECDPLNPEDTWKFVATDKKKGKIISGFKDDYPGLLPKKKNCRMSFDVSKRKCTDRNSGRSYKLLFDD